MNNKYNAAFIGVRITPRIGEATSNHTMELAKIMNSFILTSDDIGLRLYFQRENTLILNGKFINNRTPLLYTLNGVSFVSLAKYYSKYFNTIYLTEDLRSRWHKYMPLNKCIHFVSNNLFFYKEEEISKYVKNISENINAIITHTPLIKKQLESLGINHKKIHHIYPGINLDTFCEDNYKECHNNSQFNLLFASAPTIDDGYNDYYTEKGVDILLEALVDVSKSIECKTYLLWRNKYNDRILKEIKERKLKNIVFINNKVEMKNYYQDTHLTVIPYRSLVNSPDIPMSALESLASNVPVVSTNIPHISEIIKKEKCGSICNPDSQDLAQAILKSYDNYNLIKMNCRKTVEKYFDINNEIKKISKIKSSYSD